MSQSYPKRCFRYKIGNNLKRRLLIDENDHFIFFLGRHEDSLWLRNTKRHKTFSIILIIFSHQIGNYSNINPHAGGRDSRVNLSSSYTNVNLRSWAFIFISSFEHIYT